jgi:DNA-binding LytR/AlgR family response regulator
MQARKKIHCIIVDDEPIARKILLNYVEQMPQLHCVSACKNALEALEAIQSDDTIQIAFLDINMPNLSGMALAKIIPERVQVVFTTAYSEFAVASYELSAADYLLKPFLFERFAQAATKAIERVRMKTILLNLPEQDIVAPHPFYLKSGGENHLVQPSEILYCEAMRNHTRVVLANGQQLFPLVPLSTFEADLTAIGAVFLRTHRSYIVSRAHIGPVGASYVMVGDARIPIGYQFKAAFLAGLGLSR